MSLRLATLDDMDPLYTICMEFLRAHKYTYDIDGDKVQGILHDYLTTDNETKVVLVSEDKTGQPRGILLGFMAENVFNRDKIAVELGWYVDPEHRTSRHSIELLKAFEFWGRKLGAGILQLSSINDDYADRLDKFYSRRGFTLAERSYIKVLK